MNLLDQKFGLNSEYKTLQTVLMFLPGRKPSYNEIPENVLHKHQINYELLETEIYQLINTYQAQKITIFFIESSSIEIEEENCLFNLMYTRDLMFMTPQGAIIGRMCKKIRGCETGYVRNVLESHDIPIIAAVQGSGTFEGADAIWLSKNKVLIGIGNRTNMEGFLQVQNVLTKLDIECIPIPFEKQFPQHLLGVLQIVDSGFALVRTELIHPQAIKELRTNGYQILEVPEIPEVSEGQAMNIVTVNPREIIMPMNSPITKKLYSSAGIKVLVEVPAGQLINGGGGIACATLPIFRQQ